MKRRKIVKLLLLMTRIGIDLIISSYHNTYCVRWKEYDSMEENNTCTYLEKLLCPLCKQSDYAIISK